MAKKPKQSMEELAAEAEADASEERVGQDAQSGRTDAPDASERAAATPPNESGSPASPPHTADALPRRRYHQLIPPTIAVSAVYAPTDPAVLGRITKDQITGRGRSNGENWIWSQRVERPVEFLALTDEDEVVELVRSEYRGLVRADSIPGYACVCLPNLPTQSAGPPAIDRLRTATLNVWHALQTQKQAGSAASAVR